MSSVSAVGGAAVGVAVVSGETSGASPDDGSVAAAVRAWCIEHGRDKDLRIVLAGYDSEHGELAAAGWTEHEWFTDGYLTGGMSNTAGSGKHQQARERLWASPGCLSPTTAAEKAQAGPLFGEAQ